MSRDVVDSWFGAFRYKDISMLKLADDFVHSSPYGEVQGGETHLNMVRKNEEAFFSSELEIIDVLEDGDKFAVRYLVNGNPACDYIYVRDGLIAEIHAYFNLGETPSGQG